MTDYAELHERIKAATGPDRELDFDIHDAVTGRINQYAPAYTFSTEEALRLVEERFLEEWPTILRAAISDLSRRFYWHISFPQLGQRDLLPLAIISALLAELISRAEK